MEKSKYNILVFANFDYLAVLENWIRFVERLQIENYTIVALDQQLYQYLKDKRIEVIYRPCELGLEKLWVHRVRVIREFVDDGYDIVHSDADAVWLQNPLSLFDELNSDLVFSQGTIWPPQIHQKWGFVLCCGLFMIKHNAKTRDFLIDWLERVEVDMDDQVSLNTLLSEQDISWESDVDTYKVNFRQDEFKCFESVLHGKTKGKLSVAMLPHKQFQRIKEQSNNVYVKHLISEKNSDSIVEVLRQNDCFIG